MPEKQLHLCGAIVVERRSDDWHAHIAGNRAQWGCGPSIQAAIGCVVMSHPEQLAAAVCSKEARSTAFPDPGACAKATSIRLMDSGVEVSMVHKWWDTPSLHITGNRTPREACSQGDYESVNAALQAALQGPLGAS